MFPVPMRLTFVLSMTLTAASPALAWNGKGHMTVAYVAYHLLTPTVRARVDDLLARNPYYNKWEMAIPANVVDAEKKLRIFMLAATWPDAIKGDPEYTDDGTDNGNRPNGAISSQNTGYADKLRHKYWHFVDTPFTRDGSVLPPIPDPNAQERIHLFRNVLASTTASDDLKSYDLTWLLHLVGDVHQPLHSATRVSASQPDGDQGGNLVELCSAPCRLELHAFWDDVLGTEQPITPAENLAGTLPAAAAAAANILDEATWVRQSFELTKTKVYKSPIGAGAGPFTITTAYRTAAKALARKQVALAGARLGNLLNAELK